MLKTMQQKIFLPFLDAKGLQQNLLPENYNSAPS
jgi:hypothetical protein